MLIQVNRNDFNRFEINIHNNLALDALQMEHPMFKICSMSQASSASKKKAKNTIGIILLLFFFD
jgi:hypothetical protein